MYSVRYSTILRMLMTLSSTQIFYHLLCLYLLKIPQQFKASLSFTQEQDISKAAQQTENISELTSSAKPIQVLNSSLYYRDSQEEPLLKL